MKSGALIYAKGDESIFVSCDRFELIYRINLLNQEEKAGSVSKIVKSEKLALVDKIFDNYCLRKQNHAKLFAFANS